MPRPRCQGGFGANCGEVGVVGPGDDRLGSRAFL